MKDVQNPQLPKEPIDPILELRRSQRNRLANMLTDSGIEPTRFRFGKSGSRNEWERIEYWLWPREEVAFEDTPVMSTFMFRVARYPTATDLRYSLPTAFPDIDGFGFNCALGDDRRLGVKDWPTFFGHFGDWLGHVKQCYDVSVTATMRRSADAALPDMWTNLLSRARQTRHARGTGDSDVTAAEAAEVQLRLLRTLEELPLLGDGQDNREALTQEIKEHSPRAGDKWHHWRDAFIGWGVGRVLDGVMSSTMFHSLLNSVWSFVVRSVAVSPPPQLLP